MYFLVVTDCCFIYSCNTGYIYRGESGNEGYFHGVVGNVFTHVYILGNRSFHVVTFHLSDRGSRGNFRGLAALNMVGSIWQEYAFMRDITHWLSISSRIISFYRG